MEWYISNSKGVKMNSKQLKIKLLDSLIKKDREDLSESDIELMTVLAYDEEIECEMGESRYYIDCAFRS